MEDALDNEIEMDEVCHPERSAQRGVEGSRAASAGESSEWAQLAACLHPGVSVRLPLSRIPSKSYAHVKRVFDITFSAGAVVILSPVLLACAVAVKATSPGPVLFRQERWGRAGERFECIKFRTMLVETPPDMPAQDFADKAAFMTPVGDFLRRWSLDELPQLANILKGDIPLRILKTRPEFSEKSMGAFALPAKSSTNKVKVFSQVVSCFASGLRVRRVSECNCNRIDGMGPQFLAKPVFGVSPVHTGSLFHKPNNGLAKAAW